jgi:hypothetical protein
VIPAAAVGVLALGICYLIFRDIRKSATDKSLMTGEILSEQTSLTEWEKERLGWIETGERRQGRRR